MFDYERERWLIIVGGVISGVLFCSLSIRALGILHGWWGGTVVVGRNRRLTLSHELLSYYSGVFGGLAILFLGIAAIAVWDKYR